MLNALVQRTRSLAQPLPAAQLATHVFSTYANVRYGMAAIAFAFPLILYLGGLIAKVPLQCSMSAYYWAIGAACGQTSTGMAYPPMRIYFVGILFIVGAFLYLYKGFTPLENYALNTSGVCALGVALFPMSWGDPSAGTFNMHGASAVTLFLCIAYVSIFRATDTLALVQDAKLERRYRSSYRICGAFMVAAPLVAFVATVLAGNPGWYVFFIETAGIWAFAAYWLLKSRELARTNAELHAAHGLLSTTPGGLMSLVGPVPPVTGHT